jgi:hypothetical protein
VALYRSVALLHSLQAGLWPVIVDSMGQKQHTCYTTTYQSILSVAASHIGHKAAVALFRLFFVSAGPHDLYTIDLTIPPEQLSQSLL